jgi:hypothetical protein
MVNRYLSLLVSVAAPAAAALLLMESAHPMAVATPVERAPCLALALLALTLAVIHLRIVPARGVRAEAAMWSGLALFLFVATLASPYLGLFGIAATLSLAGTSVARLVARPVR